MDNRTKQAIISVLERRSSELEKSIYFAEHINDHDAAKKMKDALSDCSALLSRIKCGDI